MYVSLTYPFNIVQHPFLISHIVEHRKLDSLGTPDQLWRHVGPTMFVNLTPALYCVYLPQYPSGHF